MFPDNSLIVGTEAAEHDTPLTNGEAECSDYSDDQFPKRSSTSVANPCGIGVPGPSSIPARNTPSTFYRIAKAASVPMACPRSRCLDWLNTEGMKELQNMRAFKDFLR